MKDIDKTLEERGKRYGDFLQRSCVAQDLKDAMRRASGWRNLRQDQKQALDVIADKQSRILCGDPNHKDNWHDICGYSKLAEDGIGGSDD